MIFPAVYKLGFRVGMYLVGVYASARQMVLVAANATAVVDQACYREGVSEVIFGATCPSNASNSSGHFVLPLLEELIYTLSNLNWVDVFNWLRQWPIAYKNWWMNLVTNDPVHVLVETTLIVSIIYMAIMRGPQGSAPSDCENLTPEEQEELLHEWKMGRAPLAPVVAVGVTVEEANIDDSSASSAKSESTAKRRGSIISFPKSRSSKSIKSSKMSFSADTEPSNIVVHKQYGRYMEISTSPEQDAPKSTVLNFATFDFLGMQKPEHTPQLPPPNSNGAKESSSSASSSSLPFMRKKKTQKSASGSNSDLFSDEKSQNPAKEASRKALEKYGVGSCGPRGFYGTIDAHLDFEERIAEFTRTDGAIMYSDGASTCSSTVAAFAKRGDLLIVDEGVYEPIVTGVVLSRANVHWFRHNDMEDLERILKQIQDTDKRLGRKSNAQRRFIVVEGLYKNLGTICPLDQVVELKHKYNYRLMLDESYSFGTLGATGRGALELYGKEPMRDAEIITIALENSLGSIGGVTVGNEEVVDHQRLSGAGYCFSASSPPFTAVAATAALKILDQDPYLLHQLRDNVAYLYQQLSERTLPSPLIVSSDKRSPIAVLQLEYAVTGESKMLRKIMRSCLRRGVALVATGYELGCNQHRQTVETELAPSLRITVSALHTKADIDMAVTALIEESKVVLERFPVASTSK